MPLLAMLAALIAASPAQASFHLIKVREVFPGTTTNPESDYVELQMYSTGQSLVNLGDLEVLNSTGTVTSHFSPSGAVPHSANQSTVLIANTGFSSQFPSVTPDFSDGGLNLDRLGGAVCWPQNEPPFDDCASWGSFTGQASLPSPGDSAAAVAIPNGMALRRTISPGCSTLLENADDSNDSAVDFSPQIPNPRNNTATPSEQECAALPNTVVDAKPANPTKATAASFTYHAIPASEAEFECSLDGAPFSSCATTGISYPGPLSATSHTFEVRAVNPAGADSTPAAYIWTVDTTAPTATIQTHPADPSPGTSAAFTYRSSEVGSKFECSLASGVEPDSFSSCATSGKTFGGLADGTYTFKVRATDAALNQGVPASFGWTVDNSLADTTPPQTTIESRPADPSDSSTASFTYSSNEPGSSFQCMLGGAGFTACPPGGTTYTDLGNGAHSFAVRATDSSGNIDPTPAGYSFTVVLAGSPMAPSPPLIPRPTPTVAPATKLLGKPPATTHDRTPTFRFGSSQGSAVFQCKIDRSSFKACRSPFTAKKLFYGNHTFQVRAIAAGAADSSPAKLTFRVLRP
ncbi:MAG TPA: hypothetical protein VGN84_05105 [Solirubrobacterales bacterium]|nr:hypothetical protein [Solirubrobacterales bacterium]